MTIGLHQTIELKLINHDGSSLNEFDLKCLLIDTASMIVRETQAIFSEPSSVACQVSTNKELSSKQATEKCTIIPCDIGKPIQVQAKVVIYSK